MSCYRRVTAWGLVFPSLLPPTSVKPLSGRPLVPLPLTLAEVHCTVTATARVLLDVCWKWVNNAAAHAWSHSVCHPRGPRVLTVKTQRAEMCEVCSSKSKRVHPNLCSFKVPVVANSITVWLTLLKPLLPESFTSPIAALRGDRKVVDYDLAVLWEHSYPCLSNWLCNSIWDLKDFTLFFPHPFPLLIVILS